MENKSKVPLNRKQRRLREKAEKRAFNKYLSQLNRSKTKVSEDFKKLPEEKQINTLLNILNEIKELNKNKEMEEVEEDGATEN